MHHLNEIIKELIHRKKAGLPPITLLAVCPNSSAVLEAAVNAAARNRSVMLFAATLNQVDFEASYTGWTPQEFVGELHGYAEQYHWSGPLYPCLDHGGPWLKDLHTLAHFSYAESMEKVKTSISYCLDAGYQLLHIDPTVDRSLPAGQPLPLEMVVERTVELIAHAEHVRHSSGLPELAYEVGTEEVHGGLVKIQRFEEFINMLHKELRNNNLEACWPCLLVAQVGTDLHTTTFQPKVAQQLFHIVSPYGSLIKGHYTDWVEKPQDYPTSGMGAANVGPEFTATEFEALQELEGQEIKSDLQISDSRFMYTLEMAVIQSGRWKKWLLPEEKEVVFDQLSPSRKAWLLKTGSRYIWTNPDVVAARGRLYSNLRQMGIDAQTYVIGQITKVIERYIQAFNLVDSIDLFR